MADILLMNAEVRVKIYTVTEFAPDCLAAA